MAWTYEKIICGNCKKEFDAPVWRHQKFCSYSCARTGHPSGMLGKKHPEKWKVDKSNMMKGKIPINISRGDFTGENHYLWKGDKVSYGALHNWVKRNLGKPDTCEHCGKNNLHGHKIHWANKSHNYLINLNDWLRLCAKCHADYDGNRGRKKEILIYG